jgi:hypothetical protein
MKQALVIKTEMLLKADMMKHYQNLFAEQLKTGVVIIPAYFQAELLNVPTDVEVIVQAGPDEHEFLKKHIVTKEG